MTRHEIREEAFLLLFQMQMSNFEIGEIVDSNVESFELEVNKTAIKLAEKVYDKKEELDAIIASFSKTRAVNRIAKVNIVIMEIALYEMIYDDKVPPKVAINEAIELAKKYADATDTKFINGILDAYFNNKEDLSVTATEKIVEEDSAETAEEVAEASAVVVEESVVEEAIAEVEVAATNTIKAAENIMGDVNE